MPVVPRLGVRLLCILGLIAVATTFACTPGRDAHTGSSSSGLCPADPAAQKQQLRGMWVASVRNIDWPSKPGLSVAQQQAELIGWLDLARARHLNAVMLQVRPDGDAFWPSPYEPWSQWLTGTQGRNPGYDPLAFAVREAHKRNLELHAWFNPYRAGVHADPRKLTPTHPARVHPDWTFPYGGALYYNPGVPEVRQFVETAILDAVRRYDIDGVHFDDYFYPYPVPGKKLPDQKTFERYGHGFTSIDAWRRHNVDLLVSELHQRIHAIKPWVRFGVSPFGIWRNKRSDPHGSDTHGLESYSAIYADSRGWVKHGYVDYVAPQLYWNMGFPAADYAKLVPWWADVVRGTDVQLYIGQGDYKLGAAGAWRHPDELSRHLTYNERFPEVRGDVHFSATTVRADPVGGVSRMVDEHYAHPALVPPMPRLGGRTPAAPVAVSVKRGDGGVRVTWKGRGRPATSYAVYRFTGDRAPACGFADATHLAATRRGARSGTQTYLDASAKRGTTYTYYVTALDRVWDESGPSDGATAAS
ncbi:MAG: family 10 glycosylhydrolase [Streptosporangiales bacterium]|nr:family 10 glycosylhydrolase [Streptosporangiales bacterium]